MGTLPPTRLRNSTGLLSFQRQAHIVHHLAGAEFHHGECPGVFRQLANLLRRGTDTG